MTMYARVMCSEIEPPMCAKRCCSRGPAGVFPTLGAFFLFAFSLVLFLLKFIHVVNNDTIMHAVQVQTNAHACEWLKKQDPRHMTHSHVNSSW